MDKQKNGGRQRQGRMVAARRHHHHHLPKEREREKQLTNETFAASGQRGRIFFFFSSTARRIEIPSRTKKRRRVNKVTEEAERTRDCVPSPTTAAANPSKSKRGDQNGTLDPSLIRLKPSRYTCGGLVGLLYTQPL